MKKFLFTLAALTALTTMNAQGTAAVITSAPGGGIDTPTASHSVNINVSGIALIDIHNSATAAVTDNEVTAVTFNIDQVGQSEGGIFSLENSTANLTMNHTYVPSSASTANINVSLAAVKPGVNIYVTPSNLDLTNGGGTFGNPTNAKTLLTAGAAIPLRSAVGSSYTGDGSLNGTGLLYSLEVDKTNFGLFTAGNFTTTATYSFSAL